METSKGTQNNDLVWGFDRIKKQDLAREFVTRFESRLCVYSPSVEQVYTNYSINFSSQGSGKMIVLPDPFAFHDTFSFIAQDSLRDTGMFIVPGSLIKKSGLYIIVKYKNQTGKSIPLPLRHALRKMIATKEDRDPFLPILLKGDLREFNATTPCLHLHKIRLSGLENRSEFEKNTLKNAIFEKLKALHNDAVNIANGL